MAENENLAQKKCLPCEGGVRPFPPEEIRKHLSLVPGWELQKSEIVRAFSFKNFDQTMAFVNGVADIARREDHHPEMEVSYKICKVHYSTHAAEGLTENDFICAAKINELFKN